MDEGAVHSSVSSASASVACGSCGCCCSSCRRGGGGFVVSVPSVASILKGGGPFRAGWQGAHPAVVIIVGALTLWLYLVAMVRGRHLVGSVDRFVGSILILILVLLWPVVSIAADSAAALLLLLPLMLTMRSALTEGRAPSYVGINLLIEVGVVACAGCAGLLGGGTRVDVGMFTIPASPPSAFATGGGASRPATAPTLHLSGGVSPGRIPPPALIATTGSSRRHDGGYRCVPRLLHGQSELFSLATGRVCAATGALAVSKFAWN